MAVSYLRRDMTGEATFSLFVRGVPKQRGFLVAAGLERCLDYLEAFSFAEEDLAYLGSIGFDERALADLAPLRFDGDVWAMPEGTIVHGGEPIMEVSASIPVAQLVESSLLNQITLHTDDRLEGGAVRHRRRRQGARRLRAPAGARHRGGGGRRARVRDRRLRGDLERRRRASARSPGRRHDGAFLRRGVRLRGGGVPRVREGPPGPHDVPGGHVRHAERRPERDRDRPRAGDHGRDRRAPGQRQPRSAGARGARDPRRGGIPERAHLRQRWAGRARGRRAGARRRAGGRVRHRHAARGLRRRALRRYRLQAGGVRRQAGDEAVGRESDRARAANRSGGARTICSRCATRPRPDRIGGRCWSR